MGVNVVVLALTASALVGEGSKCCKTKLVASKMSYHQQQNTTHGADLESHSLLPYPSNLWEKKAMPVIPSLKPCPLVLFVRTCYTSVCVQVPTQVMWLHNICTNILQYVWQLYGLINRTTFLAICLSGKKNEHIYHTGMNINASNSTLE